MLTPEQKKGWEEKISKLHVAVQFTEISQRVPWEMADRLIARIKELTTGPNARGMSDHTADMYTQAADMALYMKAIGIFSEAEPPQEAREWALSYRNMLRSD